jgi:transposase InsO family protein
MLRQFPFRILGFHTGNGSQFINRTVAGLLNKLLIEQTKSRPRQSGDNGLVETKNGAPIPGSPATGLRRWGGRCANISAMDTSMPNTPIASTTSTAST